MEFVSCHTQPKQRFMQRTESTIGVMRALRNFCVSLTSPANSFIYLASAGGILHKDHYWLGQPVLMLFILVLLLFSIGIFISLLQHRNLFPIMSLSGALSLLFLNAYLGQEYYFIIGVLLLVILSSFLNEIILAKKP